MTILILLSIICFICFLNLIFILVLSNFIFRFFILLKNPENKENNSNLKEESNLIDLKNSLSYDPRFSSQIK